MLSKVNMLPRIRVTNEITSIRQVEIVQKCLDVIERLHLALDVLINAPSHARLELFRGGH